MKKWNVRIALISCLSAMLLTAPMVHAMTNTEIEKRLKQIQQDEAKAAKERQQAEQDKKDVTARKNEEVANMQVLQEQIDEQGNKLKEVEQQIVTTTANLYETGEQLQEAEKRVEARDQLLKSRLRLMYTNGAVSYLEVLLDSTSFSDFLDRFEALKTIINQDKDILEANKKDRAKVEEKKVEIEDQLVAEQKLHAEFEMIKQELVRREKDKEVLIASLAKEEEAFDHITEEQEEALKKLANEKAKLYAERDKNNSKAVFVNDGKYNWPLPGRTYLSSGFGYRVDPINKSDANHTGWDIPAPSGTDIHASAAGTVVVAQFVNGYGNTVVIDHGGGMQTWYGHIKPNGIDVKEGDKVKAGDVIAHVGTTGRSTGNHLHFEFRKNGSPVNPGNYVKPS